MSNPNMNNFRKKYLAYFDFLCISTAVGVFIASFFTENPILKFLFRLGTIMLGIFYPLIALATRKSLLKSRNLSSDEREQEIIKKSFMNTGFLAFTLCPFLLVLPVIFPAYALYIAVGFAGLLGGVFKLSIVWNNFKY